MGLSASQGRMLLLTARQTDLEYRAQQISQKRLVLSQQLEEIAVAYEEATSNRQMKIALFLNDDSTGSDIVNRSSNLTYSTLVSGTLAQFNPTQSGIQGYDRTNGQMYSSTSAYRLVSSDGLIVVSSKDEIPTTLQSSYVTESSPEQVKDSSSNDIANLYEVKVNRKDANNNEVVDNSMYYAVANGELLNIFGKKDESKYVKIDINQGIVATEDDKGLRKYYYLENGEPYQKENSQGVLENAAPDYFTGAQVVLVKSQDKIPQTQTVNTVESNVVVQEGKNGRYDLVTEQGDIIASYLVDEGLKYGSTQVNGATDGPNYLQDCLRNGKYLLEKGSYSKEEQNVKWSSLAWDGTANISDGYYLEDDDRAKAKYDRLQTQIQIQDKKLELELDNIETQRKAVTTEQESVKKVMEENIKGSFNVFG